MILLQFSVATILVYLILRGDVYSDYQKWLNEKYGDIKHTKEGWRRFFFLCPSIILYTLCLRPGSFWSIVIGLFLSGFLIASWYWTFFDGWFNVKRGFRFFYKGTNDMYDANIDNLVEKLSTKTIALIKISLILISTLCYLNFILSWMIFRTNLR